MARGGYRANGGRKAGGKNKLTIERELIAERIAQERMQDAAKPGRKLAREVLDDLMHLALQYAAMHQPLPVGVQPGLGQEPSQEKFVLFANMAGDFAGKLAKFQSPTFKSIEVHADPSLVAPGMPAAGAVATDGANRLTPQQAYRLLRDADVIDMPGAATPAQKAAAKKAASG